MAQRIVTRLVDDLTGEEIVADKGETISFALDGQSYVIDLASENARAFREHMKRYIAVATKMPRRRSNGTARVSA